MVDGALPLVNDLVETVDHRMVQRMGTVAGAEPEVDLAVDHGHGRSVEDLAADIEFA